jgi:rhodanese-related sulfurtransferase
MYLEFLLQNLLLFGGLAVVVALLLLLPVIQSAQGIKQVAALHLPQLQRDDHLIVDVSEPKEYERAHLPESTNIPLQKLLEDHKKLDRHQKNNVILTCQSGSKSATAARHLKKAGFEKVFVLSGGLAGWQKENLPVEP